MPPFDNLEHEKIFERGEELRKATLDMSSDKTFRERALEYEKFLAEHWFESKFVDFITFYQLPKTSANHIPPLLRADHDETISLPFEGIEVSAPAGYESLLTTQYGDWRRPVMSHVHAKVWSADISYKEYFRLRAK